LDTKNKNTKDHNGKTAKKWAKTILKLFNKMGQSEAHKCLNTFKLDGVPTPKEGVAHVADFLVIDDTVKVIEKACPPHFNTVVNAN
jgi:hypothetical protein